MVNFKQKLPLLACSATTLGALSLLTALNSRFWSFSAELGSRSPFWDPNTDGLPSGQEFLTYAAPGIVAIVACVLSVCAALAMWLHLWTFRALHERDDTSAKAYLKWMHRIGLGGAAAAAFLGFASSIWWAAGVSTALGWPIGDVLGWSWWLLLLSCAFSASGVGLWQKHWAAPYSPPPAVLTEAGDGRSISAGFDRRGRPRASQDYDHLGIPIAPAPGAMEVDEPVHGPSSPVMQPDEAMLSPVLKLRGIGREAQGGEAGSPEVDALQTDPEQGAHYTPSPSAGAEE